MPSGCGGGAGDVQPRVKSTPLHRSGHTAPMQRRRNKRGLCDVADRCSIAKLGRKLLQRPLAGMATMAGWHPKAAGLLAAQFLPLDQWRRHAWPVAILLLLLLPVINATFLWFEDRYLGAHFESSSGHHSPIHRHSSEVAKPPEIRQKSWQMSENGRPCVIRIAPNWGPFPGHFEKRPPI